MKKIFNGINDVLNVRCPICDSALKFELITEKDVYEIKQEKILDFEPSDPFEKSKIGQVYAFVPQNVKNYICKDGFSFQTNSFPLTKKTINSQIKLKRFSFSFFEENNIFFVVQDPIENTTLIRIYKKTEPFFGNIHDDALIEAKIDFIDLPKDRKKIIDKLELYLTFS